MVGMKWYSAPVNWPRVIVIAVGVYLGLQLATCGIDNRPEAATTSYDVDLRISRRPIPGQTDIEFYQLCFSKAQDTGACVTLAGDRDLALIRWLHSHDEERVYLHLGAVGSGQEGSEKGVPAKRSFGMSSDTSGQSGRSSAPSRSRPRRRWRQRAW